MIIYKITNTVNGKSYIGQTIKPISNRIKEHVYRCFVLNKAIHKYGIDNFTWEVLCECDSKAELDEMEFHYIKQYDTFGRNGYNLTLGGDGVHGWKASKEQRKKLSNAHKGKKLSKETRKKLSNAHKGKIVSEETRKKISDASTGKNNGNAKEYLIIHPDGKEEMIKCLKTFCDDHNLSYGTMISIISGKVIHCNLYRIKGHNHDKKVLSGYEITHPDNTFSKVKSLPAFCKDHCLSGQSMLLVAKGKQKHHRGYKCKKLFSDLYPL